MRVDAAPLACAPMRGAAGEPSGAVRARVRTARARQTARWGPAATNARALAPRMAALLEMSPSVQRAAAELATRAGPTSRGFARVLRVARTIADLEDSLRVVMRHVLDAVDFRVALGGPAGATVLPLPPAPDKPVRLGGVGNGNA